MSHVTTSWASSPGPSRRVCRLPKRQSGQRLSPRRPRAATRAADLSRRVVVADHIARMRSPRPEVGRGRSLLDRRTDQPMAAISHLSIARWISPLVRQLKTKIRYWRSRYAHARYRHNILCPPAPMLYITDNPSPAASTKRGSDDSADSRSPPRATRTGNGCFRTPSRPMFTSCSQTRSPTN